MTDAAPGDSPALKATDEDILTAVERVSVSLDAPAVPTSQVAAELPIERQTVKRRLDDLAEAGRVASLPTGQGRIWWLPEGKEGHVDPAALDRTLEDVDPHDVPPGLAREIAEKRLPEFQPAETRWERLHKWGTGRADDVVGLVSLAVVFLLVPSPGILRQQLSVVGIGVGETELIGLVLFGAGTALALTATGARVAGVLGRHLTESGNGPEARD